MNGKQFKYRLQSIAVVLFALLLGFSWVLYDVQIVHGAEYREKSRRKIANTETVAAARGGFQDRYGRVLVSNRTSYNVSLDLAVMGEGRNEIVTKLLDICRAQGISWADTLPISKAPPFVYTLDTASDIAVSRFQKLIALLDWKKSAPSSERIDALHGKSDSGAGGTDGESTPPDPVPVDTIPQVSADALVGKMLEYFAVDADLPAEEARALLGVLYEMTLRAKDVAQVSYVFTEGVDINFITAVKEGQLAGVRIDTSAVRQYHTPYAAHLLGRVGQMDAGEQERYKELGYAGDESVGKDGVEKAFEAYLHGTEGIRDVETNTQGKIVSESWVIDPVSGEVLEPSPGYNVSLTLDIRLQEVVERSLAERIPQLPSLETRGGAAVVIDVNDGGVLAMASYPTYDISRYSTQFYALRDDPLTPFLNRATQGLYAPGSTYKMVVATGALEQAIIDVNTKIKCTGRYTYYKNKSDQPQCWIYRQSRGTHQNETVMEAIRDSCNIFFYDTGRRLGIDLLGQYSKMFGLGEKTGIEVSEKIGHVAGRAYTEAQGETWYEGNVLSASIGQEKNEFTPLQLANYVATLVNGGTHYSAHLLRTVKSNDFSQVILQREGEALDAIQIAPQNLSAIKEGMYEAALKVSAFKNLGFKVGAKTGSAQVGSASQSNAVFVCFAPYDDPQVAIAIVVEKGGSGAELGSIAADILEYYFSTGNAMDTVAAENTILR